MLILKTRNKTIVFTGPNHSISSRLVDFDFQGNVCGVAFFIGFPTKKNPKSSTSRLQPWCWNRVASGWCAFFWFFLAMRKGWKKNWSHFLGWRNQKRLGHGEVTFCLENFHQRKWDHLEKIYPHILQSVRECVDRIDFRQPVWEPDSMSDFFAA